MRYLIIRLDIPEKLSAEDAGILHTTASPNAKIPSTLFAINNIHDYFPLAANLSLYHGSFKPSNQISQFGVNKSLIHRLGGEYFLPVA